ncbi:MAG TPA: bacteriohopanetetrol glucosamine biosynthesis glycosyltransferase HpnI [Candidatus Cybelea sp.]|nr:bacteriohopanetetrol glucosamine biosynthesis glycosyltransferase HpnI [Candidatus Cybelea sp.]
MAWTVTRDLLLLLALGPLVYFVFAMIIGRSFFAAAERPAADCLPSLSILRPIHGLDREMYQNYASFCSQEYPDFEMLFCVSDETDPAIPAIRKVIEDFPERSIRLLIGSEPLGVSDKVNKLCRMAKEARHELLIVADSDVRLEPGFLRSIAAPFADPTLGGTTCLYRGITDGSLAADLEALGNSTDFAPGVLAARRLAGIDFMLGALMATTKTRLAEIGGFESLVEFFSDDYELGNRIAKHGHRIELSRSAVSIVYPRETVGQAFRHQTRWHLSIRHSRPGAHFGLIFTQGLAWTILAAAISPFLWMKLAYVAAYLVLRTALAWTVGVSGMHDELVRRKIWMLPLRDLLAFSAWMTSFFGQRIDWRGEQFYVRDRRLVRASPRQC